MMLVVIALSHVRLVSRGRTAPRGASVLVPDDATLKGSLEPGLYAPTANTETFSFTLDSFSEFNQWRHALNNLALGLEGRRFDDLLALSNADVVIGPEAAAVLSRAFRQYADHAEASGPVFFEQYQHWLRAFTVAAEQGLVAFTSP